MGHRYLTLWAAYADVFGLPARLDGLDVLDVGAATGASSLLFAALGAARVAVPDSTTGPGLPHQTSELARSVESKSMRLIFGRVDGSRRALEAEPKKSRRSGRVRARCSRVEDATSAQARRRARGERARGARGGHPRGGPGPRARRRAPRGEPLRAGPLRRRVLAALRRLRRRRLQRRALPRHGQGRTRVLQVRFNMRVPRAIVPEKASTRRERSER
mmetsp:Transcript_13487/g.46293  ORF Transcript_13487/g.46293 Transcript_13487/m.46293 type:complete len:217 (-) Transcript_13487:4-654(-)